MNCVELDRDVKKSRRTSVQQTNPAPRRQLPFVLDADVYPPFVFSRVSASAPSGTGLLWFKDSIALRSCLPVALHHSMGSPWCVDKSPCSGVSLLDRLIRMGPSALW
jgi:hypothetical protein